MYMNNGIVNMQSSKHNTAVQRMTALSSKISKDVAAMKITKRYLRTELDSELDMKAPPTAAKTAGIAR